MKPRAWSKYAKDSTAYSKLHPEDVPVKSEDTRVQKKKKEAKDSIQDPKVKELLEKASKIYCTGYMRYGANLIFM